jgi:hypothetical protein
LPIGSDEESDIIEANVLEDEMNDCKFGNEIHLCEHCCEDQCDWIINPSHVEEWARRQLQDVPRLSTSSEGETLTESQEVFPLCGQACLGLSW